MTGECVFMTNECALMKNTHSKMTDACTSANYTALGLTSHTAIWFRIAALGAKGAGPWSDPLKASIK